MITHISIRNFAIIEDVRIDFNDGLNIITGETGAGKSIVIEAVSLALGARADATYVRTGTDKAIVEMIAELDGNEYIISREVSAQGRNICRINGNTVPLSQVCELCEKIADIHGQYDHQSLLNPDCHISLIDKYDKKTITPLKKTVASFYSQYSEITSKLNLLIKGESERKRKRDFMAFELDEITKANLRPGEDTELESEITVLENSEKISSNLEKAYILSQETESISEIKNLLSEISSYGAGLEAVYEQISEIYYAFEDITRELRTQKDSVSYSPDELDRAQERLELISSLKKKYGKNIEDILDYGRKIAEEISMADNSDGLKEKLTADKAAVEAKLKEACSTLSSARKKAADSLKKQIIKELLELNFKDADMDIVFTETSYTPEGIDNVEFMLTTNKGEELKALAKVASGGEMSRIMLAFKKIVSDYDRIPTLIFDEIDTGISGITASIVANKMKQIAENHQIICITHLPQIAAAGTHNYKIFKDVHDDATFTSVQPLSQDEKINEIARLLGGMNITETTLKSAEELIKAAT